MFAKFVKLADLYQYKKGVYNLSIEVAVSIKSKQLYNGTSNYFHMDLRDDTGEISAVAYNDASTNLHNFIKQNKVYVITTFQIGYSDRRYTSVVHDKEIVLIDDTLVEFCGYAAKMEWPPVFRTNKYVFYNIIAVCTDVAETTESDSGKLARKVTLLDEFCNEIILHVWNEQTTIFDYVNVDSYPVLFVKDARKYTTSHEDGAVVGVFVMTTTKYVQFMDSNDPRARRVREAVQNSEKDDYYEDPYDEECYDDFSNCYEF